MGKQKARPILGKDWGVQARLSFWLAVGEEVAVRVSLIFCQLAVTVMPMVRPRTRRRMLTKRFFEVTGQIVPKDL